MRAPDVLEILGSAALVVMFLPALLGVWPTVLQPVALLVGVVVLVAATVMRHLPRWEDR